MMPYRTTSWTGCSASACVGLPRTQTRCWRRYDRLQRRFGTDLLKIHPFSTPNAKWRSNSKSAGWWFASLTEPNRDILDRYARYMRFRCKLMQRVPLSGN